MAVRTNIEFFQGEDFTLQVTVVDDNGVVVDISSWVLISATILLNYGDASPAAGPYIVGTGITIIDAVAGRFDVVIPDDDTTGLTAEQYVYDVKRMDADAEAILSYGTLDLLPAATL